MTSVFQTSPKGRVAGGDTAATSFASLPTAGRGIVVLVWGWNTSLDMATSSCADNQGNTYALAVSDTQFAGGGNMAVGIFYAMDIGTPSGTFTVTVNGTGASDYLALAALETDIATTGARDQFTSNVNGSSVTTADTGTTGTTTQAAGVAVAVVATGTSGTVTITSLGSGWVEAVVETDGNTYQAGEGDYRILSATATQQETWTTSSSPYAACIATFKGAAAAAPFIPPQVDRQLIRYRGY